MTSAAAAVSIDRRRRRRGDRSTLQVAPHAPAHPLVGLELGILRRRYGLMASEERVRVLDVVATSGDLAVADRLAFVAALERRSVVVVVELDGWYVACTTDHQLDPATLAALRRSGAEAPRVMSIASERGITPSLGPLTA